jgi:hypothetical protein
MKINPTAFTAALALIASLPLAASAQTSGAQQAPVPGRMMGGQAGPGMMGTFGGPGMMGGAPFQMMGGMGMGMGMAMTDHIEGRVAFLKAELKITDAQSSSWNAFADALRANAKALVDIRQSFLAKPVAARGNFAETLDFQERWLAARLDGTRAMKTAFTALSPTLSDEQKKTADDLLARPFGMDMMMMGQVAGPR